MEEVKRIPYGVSNFVEVVEQNQYYVDKTMYLPLLEKQPSNLFFIRPRRLDVYKRQGIHVIVISRSGNFRIKPRITG